MDKVYFSLHESIYAAAFDNSVIILDSNKDKYISLIGFAASYLAMICRYDFIYENGTYIAENCSEEYDVSQLNHWIDQFHLKGFIKKVSENKKTMAPGPLKKGGLAEYQWDSKVSWKPFLKTSKWEVVKALSQLAKVHRTIKKERINGILSLIKKNSHSSFYIPTTLEIEKLAAAVDAATVLYPKKTFCLAWAATFVLLALKRKWKCHFVIGIQTTPFYAHAWAECAGKVVNDDPTITQVFSIILREPDQLEG